MSLANLDSVQRQHTVGRSNPLSKRFGSPVLLNVYDLAIDGKPLKSLNGIALKLGFGAFHSGVEVFGKEISYSYDCMLLLSASIDSGDSFFLFVL
jgi:hypothetical protein